MYRLDDTLEPLVVGAKDQGPLPVPALQTRTGTESRIRLGAYQER